MKLTRAQRIMLEILAPTPLALLLLFGNFLAQGIWQGRRPHPAGSDLLGLLFYLLYGYLIAGIPSLITAGVIEWRFARGLKPSSWRAVGLFSLLGLMSGLLMATTIMLLSSYDERLSGFLYFSVWGASTGTVLGLLVKAWSVERKTTGRESP